MAKDEDSVLFFFANILGIKMMLTDEVRHKHIVLCSLAPYGNTSSRRCSEDFGRQPFLFTHHILGPLFFPRTKRNRLRRGPIFHALRQSYASNASSVKLCSVNR